MLAALMRALEARHPSSRGHASRVAELALPVARALAWSERDVARLRVGAVVHDLGKLALATELLGKPGPLTALELAQVRRHPIAGARIVEQIEAALPGLASALYHHERWDGEGYPQRLSGPEIPVEARLVAIADAFDAMTSPRPYRGPISLEAALAEIDRCAGTQFDPVLAHASIDVWSTPARVAV